MSMTPRERETPLVQNSWTPMGKMASDHQKKNLWMYVSFGALAFAVFFCYKVTENINRQPYAFATDPSGSIYFAPMGKLSAASTVVQQEAMQAAISMLTRSPAGLDYDEFAQKLFRRDKYDRLKKEVESERAYYEARHLRLKPEISSITSMDSRGSQAMMVKVEGQLIYTGTLLLGDGQQQATQSVERFSLAFTIIPNPNLAQKARTPFIITGYKLQRFADESSSDSFKEKENQ